MRYKGRLPICCVLAVLASTPMLAAAQAPAAASSAPQAAASLPTIDFATAEQARALIAQAKASLKPGQAMGPPLPLVRVPGYRALVEYRAAPTPATSHNDDAEIMYVLEGSGTVLIGGTLMEPRRPNAANVVGTGISQGTPHKLATGSFIFVPKGVPHHFVEIGPEGLSVVTMHIPTTL